MFRSAMDRLIGKVALVTGGSRGIGAGIVEKLAQEGVSVAFTYVNATEKANRLESELSAKGGNILSTKADSSQTQEVECAIQLAMKKFGRIDILVNNAGLYFGGKIDSPDVAGKRSGDCAYGEEHSPIYVTWQQDHFYRFRCSRQVAVCRSWRLCGNKSRFGCLHPELGERSG
jgi:hypothetical protein